MKKRMIIITVTVLLILAVLFIPVPGGTYDDGGTRDYNALTYKIVVWNKLIAITDADGRISETTTYHKTSVFWFPNNRRSIDELWEAEYQRHGGDPGSPE